MPNSARGIQPHLCVQPGPVGSALLSGLVRLRFNDSVEQVQVSLRLSDPGMRYVVEELYMQRRGTALRPQDKLISNY